MSITSKCPNLGEAYKALDNPADPTVSVQLEWISSLLIGFHTSQNEVSGNPGWFTGYYLAMQDD